MGWSTTAVQRAVSDAPASENPEAFVQLYAAMEEEPQLSWLIDRIDNFDCQSLIGLLQQLNIGEPIGEWVF